MFASGTIIRVRETFLPARLRRFRLRNPQGGSFFRFGRVLLVPGEVARLRPLMFPVLAQIPTT